MIFAFVSGRHYINPLYDMKAVALLFFFAAFIAFITAQTCTVETGM